MDSRKVAVIGGGASGFAAAITAAENGCLVSMFERQDRTGNTIKVTGDGRCNIANSLTSADVYHNKYFVCDAFASASPQDALCFLEGCGIMLREEAQGRLYPQANKSTSVIDALRLSAFRFGVEEHCGRAVESVRRSKSQWMVRLEDGSAHSFDSVIMACGGGQIPSNFLPEGIVANGPCPLLGPMATDTKALRGLDKIRVKCAITIGNHREEGEATFRSYGLSGIAAFNLTRFAKKGNDIFIDFLPQFASDQSLLLLERRFESLEPATWLDLTCGMLLPLVSRAIFRQACLDPEAKPERAQLAQLDRALREFKLIYEGIGDSRLCQVRRGGIDVSQVDPNTMQIKEMHGLYSTGEMLDVDGPCGGFNLHWAWVSGIIAGRSVAHD